MTLSLKQKIGALGLAVSIPAMVIAGYIPRETIQLTGKPGIVHYEKENGTLRAEVVLESTGERVWFDYKAPVKTNTLDSTENYNYTIEKPNYPFLYSDRIVNVEKINGEKIK